MSLYFSFSCFLSLMIILCQATPILTPDDHARLQGDQFCNRGKATLKQICVRYASNANIIGYQTSALQNLSCKTGDDGKVLLDTGIEGAPWELVQDALLECIYELPPDQLQRLPYSVIKTFERGRNKYDAFEYRWDRNIAHYIVQGLNRNLLKGLI